LRFLRDGKEREGEMAVGCKYGKYLRYVENE